MNEEPHPGASRKLSGKEEALLVATASSNPPEGPARWTLELLADELVRLTEHDSISRETVRRRLTENDLKPWRKDMWCIPHIDGEYAARIEDVLDLYAQVLIGKTIDSGVIVFFLGTWRRHHWAFRSAQSGQGDDNRGADSAAAREPIHSSGWPASRASDSSRSNADSSSDLFQHYRQGDRCLAATSA